MKNKSCRLTTGQALVRYLGRQYVERDGKQNRFIEGIWGIFGHGNVAGLGQGIVEISHRDQKSNQLTGDYIPVDLVKHAESMGAHAVFAQTAKEVTVAVQKARETAGVTVVVIPV